VIAATGDSEVNIDVSHDAESRAMLVNVVDVPPLCNFILPPWSAAAARDRDFNRRASPALAKRMKREIAELFARSTPSWR